MLSPIENIKIDYPFTSISHRPILNWRSLSYTPEDRSCSGLFSLWSNAVASSFIRDAKSSRDRCCTIPVPIASPRTFTSVTERSLERKTRGQGASMYKRFQSHDLLPKIDALIMTFILISFKEYQKGISKLPEPCH